MSKVRKDPELIKKLKEMEDKKRMDSMVEALIDSPNASDLSFDQWWMMLMNERPLRAHMKEIIWAEFKSRGLQKTGFKEEYDAALKKFGL